MAKNIIIGSGILGLSVAEYLTRSKIFPSEVKIISNENRLAGSLAAAANLATKGQLFARDPHFHLKLEAKKYYRTWLENLLEELNTKDVTLDSIFCCATGVDHYLSEEQQKKQCKRVKQNNEELQKRNLPTDSILIGENNTVIYKDEAWVDALQLLKILKKVLIKRSVKFEQATFDKEIYSNIVQENKCKNIIFCTGAWTKDLIKNLSITVPVEMTKERLSIGSTFYGENLIYLNNHALIEKNADDLKTKVTFSGNNKKQFLSSTTVKIKNIGYNYQNELNIANLKLIALAKEYQVNNVITIPNEKNLNKTDGYRVGFGHSEIIISELFDNCHNIKKIVCAGAHKSGYLFAPVIGAKVQNFLC